MDQRHYRVKLIRFGDVGSVYYERDVQARTPWDALALIEQRCLVDHPAEHYDFDGIDRIWHPRPPEKA